jgi:tetratricopeptide (TPR) repeat protein
LLEELAKLNAGDAVVHNALGATYRKQGQLDKAIEAYQRAIKARPGFAEAKYNLAIAYREKGDFARAERAYQEALQANPNLVAAQFNLAVLYDLYLNRPSDALRHYRAFQSLGGQNEMVEIWIADLEKRTKAAAAPPPEAVPAPMPEASPAPPVGGPVE